MPSTIGSMYGTKPGFYLLVGPDWRGRVPAGITAAFRSKTDLGCLIPRVFQTEDPADNAALQPLLRQMVSYPLAEFDGTMKEKDWSSAIYLPWTTLSNEEWRWVNPAGFFDSLPKVLDRCPPLPGEEAIYAWVRALLAAAGDDRVLRNVLREAAEEAEASLVQPLLEFRNFGVKLPHNWTTVVNSAEFGTDYYTRTAVAKSNIFINRPAETRYFYQDLDAKGERLNGATGRYTMTFKQVPPVVHEAPLGVMTNAPTYDWHMTNLANYINLSPKDVTSGTLGSVTLSAFGTGAGLHGLPGDFTPPSRFVRAAIFSQAATPNASAEDAVFSTFHILNQFYIPKGSVVSSTSVEITEWTSVNDLKNLRWYFRSFQDQSIRMVDLKEAVAAAKGEIVMIPMEQTEQPIANFSAGVQSLNQSAN
jgi:hypothetical protein